MKKRVLSLTMAFLLAFTMLPTQAAAEELPEYEKVVEENASEEDPLEKDVLETESLEAEAPAAEVENTERTVLTEETEETVTETEPTEEVTEAPTGEETEDAEVKEEVPAEQEEVSEVPGHRKNKICRGRKNHRSSSGTGDSFSGRRNPSRRAAGKRAGDGSKWYFGTGRGW